MGRSSLLTLAFGAFFFDFDLDGRQDIFVANGHVENEIQGVQQRVRYAQPPHLFRNVGEGSSRTSPRTWVPTSRAPSSDGVPPTGTSTATATSTSPSRRAAAQRTSFGNDLDPGASWIGLLLRGTSSNPDAVGAQIRVSAGGRVQTSRVKSATGYLSQSQRAVVFGLGTSKVVEDILVIWPSGKKQDLGKLESGRTHPITEP